MRIPAFTSMYGYRSTTMVSNYTHYIYGNPKQYSDPSIRAISNRPPPIQGDYQHPTEYYRKMVRKNVMSNMDVTRHPYRLTGDPGYLITIDPAPHGSAYGDPTVSVPVGMVESTTQAAMLEMEGMSANFMEDLAQAKQAVKQMATVYENICFLISLISLKRWKHIGKLLRPTVKGVANDYLAWKYGVLPLVGTFNALTAEYKPRKGVFTVRKRSELAVDPKGFIGNSVRPYCDLIFGKAYQQVQVGLTCGVTMSADLVRQAATRFDTLDAREIAATGWALLPYSFVVDWLIPVESWLLTRSWSSYIHYQSGYVTKRLICDAVFWRTRAIPRLSGNSNMFGHPWPSVQVKSLQMQRQAYNSYTPPSSLKLNVSLRPSQLTSAAALLVQRS